MSEKHEQLLQFVRVIMQGYMDNLYLRTREEKLGSGFDAEVNSVFSTLLARQATLALGLAESPQSWNPHIAPLILRPMIECLITFRWIKADPFVRSVEYINFGLGNEKLMAHHYQKALSDRKEAKNADEISQILEHSIGWVDGQQFQQFVDVNLGSWAGNSIRRMAQDVDSEDLHKFAYVPFSACAHNQWNHVGKFNAVQCENPMHKRHYIGCIIDVDFVVDFVYRATKYFDLTIDEFDEFYGFNPKNKSVTRIFKDALEKIN